MCISGLTDEEIHFLLFSFSGGIKTLAIIDSKIIKYHVPPLVTTNRI